MMSGRWYRAYGLSVHAEIEMPEFIPAAAGMVPDIRIYFDPEATAQWAASGATEDDGDDFVPAPGGGYVMRVEGVGDYWVRDGREIGLAPADPADPVSLRLFLAGSAMGMALHQRGLLVLHGATVLRAGRAAMFVGESGDGKSTMAACLGRAGYKILGDDTMALWPRTDGGFLVWPGSRTFKLWADTISALDMPADGLGAVGERLDKFFVSNAAPAPDEPVPLEEIILLEAGAESEPASLKEITGLRALGIVSHNTYRPEYVPLLDRDAAHFKQCSVVVEHVRVACLRRPWSLDRLEETVALLDAHWAARGSGGPREGQGSAPARSAGRR
jgi:hypothetical protein